VGILATILVWTVPGVLATSNSGPGGDGDDDEQIIPEDNAIQQNMSDPITNIIIPQDAESHSASNPYVPKTATVLGGSAVTWTNMDDEDQHSATADDGSFSTGLINPGSSAQATIPSRPGATITYHCDVHPEMRGILQVSTSGDGLASGDRVSSGSGGINDTLQISDIPFAVGNYITESENSANNMSEISVVGNTTITLPNSTETIITNDTGSFTLTFTQTGGAILMGQLFMQSTDGSENATIDVTEVFSSETAPGRGIGLFSTNSSGKLAPLDGLVAITMDESQPDGSARVEFFEWKLGPFSNGTQSGVGANQTAANTPSSIPAAGENLGATARVSITPGSTTKAQDAFRPNPVTANVGDTVTWTNDDTTPHTVTSGSNAQPDSKFESSPNLTPLLAPAQSFAHQFSQPGDYPYYCSLHPNMVGTVTVS
jgi:plastocyanin